VLADPALRDRIRAAFLNSGSTNSLRSHSQAGWTSGGMCGKTRTDFGATGNELSLPSQVSGGWLLLFVMLALTGLTDPSCRFPGWGSEPVLPGSLPVTRPDGAPNLERQPHAAVTVLSPMVRLSARMGRGLQGRPGLRRSAKKRESSGTPFANGFDPRTGRSGDATRGPVRCRRWPILQEPGLDGINIDSRTSTRDRGRSPPTWRSWPGPSFAGAADVIDVTVFPTSLTGRPLRSRSPRAVVTPCADGLLRELPAARQRACGLHRWVERAVSELKGWCRRGILARGSPLTRGWEETLR